MPYTLPSQDEIRAVDLSWRRYLLPDIHPEGMKILMAEMILVLLIAVAGAFCPPLLVLIGPAVLIIVFSFYFFRNPPRVSPGGETLILSPADGIVSNITEMVPPAELGCGSEPRIRISVFMSVFSVHVNRAPVSGKVTALKYVPGKFVSVQEKDSEDNERQLIGMTTPDGATVGFVQIAGLVARRIYCPLKVGDTLEAGSVFGMIRFGSRLDVFLPPGVFPAVRPGQTMIAGESVLADRASASPRRYEPGTPLTVGGFVPAGTTEG